MKIRISREAKIGFFATVCIAAMFWGINFLKGKNVFSPNHIYYAVFDQVDGLENTNPVLINGFKVGLVKSIKFEEGNTGRFLVTLLVGKKYPIPENTVAKMISAGLLGGKAIKLEVVKGDKYISPGDTLPAQIETGLIDQLGYQIAPIKQRAEALMKEMENTLKVMSEVFNEGNRAQLNQSFVNLNKALYSINQTAAELDTTLSPNGTLRKIFVNFESISANIKNNNKDITKIVKNFSSISDTIAKIKIASTMLQVDSAMHQFNSVMTKINSGKGTIGSLIHNDTLYHNLDNASRSLDLLLKDIKENPKRYINFSLIDLSRTKYEEVKKPR
ncbi:MAG: MCE family protein [Bacteroidales bacterium]|nr:MAG: MCE family protein [Bacteroidales bacterium]